MLLINKKYNNIKKCISSDIISNIKTFEILAVTLNDITIIAVYARPQNNIDINEFQALMTIRRRILLGGDLNAKHQAWGLNKKNESGNSLFKYSTSNVNCKCQVRYSDEPTHFSSDGINGCVIDIFISKNIDTSKPLVLNELSSDHLPISINIFSTYCNNNDENRVKLNFNKTDWTKYRMSINKKMDNY